MRYPDQLEQTKTKQKNGGWAVEPLIKLIILLNTMYKNQNQNNKHYDIRLQNCYF